MVVFSKLHGGDLVWLIGRALLLGFSLILRHFVRLLLRTAKVKAHVHLMTGTKQVLMLTERQLIFIWKPCIWFVTIAELLTRNP